MRSTITAQPGLQSLYRTGSGGATILVAGFATAFAAAGFAVRFAVRFTSRVRRAAVRVRVALMILAPPADSAITSRDLRFFCSLYPGRSRSGLRPVFPVSVPGFQFQTENRKLLTLVRPLAISHQSHFATDN
jgi:hypothetical protein